MPHDGPQTAGYHIGGSRFAAPPAEPGLHVVATPIGNLRDITIRALEVLAAADVILCEDTRQSGRLLDHYGISGARQSLHEHNERERIAGILDRLERGEMVALISDAGTPLVSDPGFPLVRAVREAGYPVYAVPGASALLAALATAGLPTDRFAFHGFLPPKQGARANALARLATETGTLVFYESPRRLAASLAAMADVFGADREAAVALELTKRFERTARGPLGDLAEHFAAEAQKGEAVVMVAGASGAPADPDAWHEALAEALGEQPLRAAVDEITARFSLKRKQVYDAALALKNKG